MKTPADISVVRRIRSVSDRTLDRLTRAGLSAVVIGAALVGGVYFIDRHVDGGPSLLERRVTAAEQAVRSKPNSIGLRLQLAEVYRAANRLDSALTQYDEVLKVDARQRAALLGRGQVLAAKGELGEAAKSFRKIVGKAAGGEFAAVDQELEAAHYGLGSIALRQDRAKDAVTALERAVRIEPTDADAWYLLGTATLKAGDAKRAVAALRRAVLFVPTGWCEPYARLSEAYAALGRAPHAEYAGAMVDLCEKRSADAARRLRTLTSGPAAADAMLGLGLLAEAGSDRVGALRWYRKVLAADKANFTARTGLNRLGATAPAATPRPTAPAGHSSSGGRS